MLNSLWILFQLYLGDIALTLVYLIALFTVCAFCSDSYEKWNRAVKVFFAWALLTGAYSSLRSAVIRSVVENNEGFTIGGFVNIVYAVGFITVVCFSVIGFLSDGGRPSFGSSSVDANMRAQKIVNRMYTNHGKKNPPGTKFEWSDDEYAKAAKETRKGK